MTSLPTVGRRRVNVEVPELADSEWLIAVIIIDDNDRGHICDEACDYCDEAH